MLAYGKSTNVRPPALHLAAQRHHLPQHASGHGFTVSVDKQRVF